MTDRFELIGHPVGHSLSPVIHGAAYRELGRAGEYGLVDCPDEAAVLVQIEEVRAGRLVGANVTVPWKRVALEGADVVDSSAAEVGAANVLSRNAAGEVVAHNTDARGLADDLEGLLLEHRPVVSKPRVCIIGSGGAALGAVVACQLLGSESITVTARRFRSESLRTDWPMASDLERLGVSLACWPLDGDEASAAFRGVLDDTDLIIQATSAGMHGADSGEAVAELVPWNELPPKMAYDLVYVPAETPFLHAARQAGHSARGGLGMLVGQAVRAIEIWWGERPPLEPLMKAAREALESRQQ